MTLSDLAIRRLAQRELGGPLLDFHVHREGDLVYVLLPSRGLHATILADATADDLRLGFGFRKVKR